VRRVVAVISKHTDDTKRIFENRCAMGTPFSAGTLRSGRTSTIAMAGLEYAPPPGFVPPPARVSDSVKVRVPRNEAAVVEYPVRQRPPIRPRFPLFARH
jgi:hypothetical protein